MFLPCCLDTETLLHPTLELLTLFFLFLPYLQHMEVPRPGVELELQLLAYNHSHSNVGSELHLQPTPQLMTMLDPQPTESGSGIKPSSSWILGTVITTKPQGELHTLLLKERRLPSS